MSILSNTNIVAGASGKQTGFTIEESLRFNASQSSYLSWTPASAGNRKTWTWSGWVKLGSNIDGANRTISAVSDANNYTRFTAPTSGVLALYQKNSNIVTFSVQSSQKIRDPSAWYHFVCAVDTTQASSADRVKFYINGVLDTTLSGTIPLNTDTFINHAVAHQLGYDSATNSYMDGYLTEVNFIDGQALDPSSFGEFDSVTGVWKPAKYTGTYGTNGFYLPMQLDNTVEGFNTVTYLGTGSTQRITGVGFQPDLVWIKRRNGAYSHRIFDAVRTSSYYLSSDTTNADDSATGIFSSFDSDGFTVNGTSNATNNSAGTFVAWCWDAGNTTVSNTDGSITTTLRSSPTYGFAVMTYSGNGTDNATIGHGLGAAPKMLIWKPRNAATDWMVWHAGLSGYNYDVRLNTTAPQGTGADPLNNTAPSSSVVTLRNQGDVNGVGKDIVCYAFAEVAGYSKFGSYTGTGASGNTVTTGFKPAFVLFKRTDTSGYSWYTFDSTRNAVNPVNTALYPDLSNTDTTQSTYNIDFTDTGFTINNSNNALNASGGTYIYMAFKDTREYAYWLDDSGNNNDWQPNGGITTESTVTDTPTPYADGGNYCTANPLITFTSNSPAMALLDGNLNITRGGSGWGMCGSTIAVSTGKWYWEATFVRSGSGDGILGIHKTNTTLFQIVGYSGDPEGYAYGASGSKFNNTTGTAYGASFTNGDLIGVALDLDAGTLTFYKNNSSQGTAFSSLSGEFYPAFSNDNSNGVGSWLANFGQRPFAYTPPTGFKPLHTGNLPDSAIVDGSEYFNTVLYTGNGSTQSITGVEFQPDLVWIKPRSIAGSHGLFDAVRGIGKSLRSHDTRAEDTASAGYDLTSFNSDGFSVGPSQFIDTNTSGVSTVAWNWKANGAGVSNTDGSITSTVSANPTAGFSIVTYTGTGANATVGHGLGLVPSMVIYKRRDASRVWGVYHVSTGAGNRLYLNATDASTADAVIFNNTAPTSTVISVGGGSSTTGASGATYVAYCFADVEGYSKFGSYTGNGSADGPFIYTGFRPAFVIIKKTSGPMAWNIHDSTRSAYNVSDKFFYANDAGAERVDPEMDLLSNGFKLRTTDFTYVNQSGGTYIYMAFAENPFKNSLAR